LAVLIDEYSASASEILAAAIQDHDRGIIVGRPSYGKGLVQTVITLPNEATLKMTTARYYTPSGRCLQKGRRQDPTQGESAVFVTKSGRTVKASSGVIPDSVINGSTLPSPLSTLDSTGVILDFASERAAKLRALPDAFSVDAKMVADFQAYTGKQPAARRSALLAELEAVKQQAAHASYSKGTLSALEQARSALEREIADGLKRTAKETALVLDAEFRSRFGTEAARDEQLLGLDPVVRTARDLLTSGGFAQSH
jgi:carboxyl-terminal processing protease